MKNFAIIENGIVTNLIFANSLNDAQTVAKDNICVELKESEVAYVNGHYDGTKFYPNSPFPSWTWNNDNKEWEAPIAKPTIKTNEWTDYHWDEEVKNWALTPSPEEIKIRGTLEDLGSLARAKNLTEVASSQGYHVVAPVRVATVQNRDVKKIHHSFNNVILNNGDRILNKNQENPSENGIWIYDEPSTLCIPSPYPEDAIQQNTVVFVSEGGQAGTGWIVDTYSNGASTWKSFNLTV
jgi:hypothetical protein